MLHPYESIISVGSLHDNPFQNTYLIVATGFFVLFAGQKQPCYLVLKIRQCLKSPIINLLTHLILFQLYTLTHYNSVLRRSNDHSTYFLRSITLLYHANGRKIKISCKTLTFISLLLGSSICK